MPDPGARDNLTVARIFGEIADLLELKGENPFKIRAYRSGADLIGQMPGALADLSEPELLALPGIGRDLAKKIREIVETGGAAYHRELLALFPPSILDLLRLQGVGPKTVARLYVEAGIGSLDDLEQAARSGRIRALKGMGARKEELILRALDERRRHAGRFLLADTSDRATDLVAWLQEAGPTVALVPVGSLRRGTETCGDLDVLAIGGQPALMDRFTRHPDVERVLGRGDTKASVLLRSGQQADLRLVPAQSRGAAMQYFTGSKSHNIALRDRALQRGLRLNEYGLIRVETGDVIAGEDEDGVYAGLDLAPIPPELREGHDEIARAAAHDLPRLVERADLRGDLHMHSTATDGRDDVETMVRAARDLGLEYVAITDHSQALAMANGLDEQRALAHANHIREIGARVDGITVLAGIECDIRADGTLDLADDCLAELDLVIASVHSAFHLEPAQMTDRLLRAIEHPQVDIIGHPTGRLLLRRDAIRLDIESVIAAAARHGVALEINSLPDRLDLGDVHAKLARERGVKLVISSDAHARTALGAIRWGVTVARRAWATPDDVLNTYPIDRLRASLRRHRRAA
jgi:DNA polymerase (family X)